MEEVILDYVMTAGLVLVTIAILGLLKLLTYCFMTRSARCAPVLQTCTRHGHRINCPTHPCRFGRNNDLPWYLSNLAADVLILPLQLGLACFMMISTPLLTTPFSDVSATTGLCGRYVLCVSLGHLGYRLILVTVGKKRELSVRLSHLHLAIAIVTYSSIVVTQEGYVYGVTGMIAQFYLLLDTVRSIRLNWPSTEANRDSSVLCLLNICRISCIASCCFVTPISYTVVTMRYQSVWSMSYYSVAVAVFAQTYFMLYFITILVGAISSACIDMGTDRETAHSERRGLITTDNNRRRHLHVPAGLQVEKLKGKLIDAFPVDFLNLPGVHIKHDNTGQSLYDVI